jgi:adenylate kinase
MKPRIVLVTGVSGSGAQEAVAKLGELHPQRVRVHNVGAVMNRIAREDRLQYTASNILNAPRDALTALRTAALERIHRAINDENQKVAAGTAHAEPLALTHLVFCHATFLLKSGLREGLTLADLKHLGPDLLLTLIDAPQDIHDRLTSHPGDYLHLTIESIVKWQEFEVYVTNLFGQVVERRHFVVPQRQLETLESLLFTERRAVYVSYPMTHLPPEDRPRIVEFANELRKRFTVFDPSAVESTHNLKPYYSQVELQAINDHTVVRDLDWLIGINSECVIAYMPKIVFSSGMNDELRYGFEVGKETFIVLDCPPENGIPSLSPFTMYKSKVFFSRDDFFYYLDLAEELQDAYQWINSQMHEAIRRVKNLGGRITFESFLHECDALCRYHLSADHYSRIRGTIPDICQRVFDAWYLTAAKAAEDKEAAALNPAP